MRTALKTADDPFACWLISPDNAPIGIIGESNVPIPKTKLEIKPSKTFFDIAAI